ncbi:WcaF family extracellular polysaccharide biosynthesis acetyltransferase [Granulicella sp. dw_53]|uniref:WcaF family extracellular polysaccharide biosynthesis acetyltransferase n=1 Tax=Granulicella sp. dw_53 TaxID=2719792 RepID=UPI001BD686C2|nr:WcaF family extracellular polysaccharide biosynthesis acetyltransferase [Granulicella sp. dw_53]
MSVPIQLRNYNNSWYRPGRSILWRSAWLFFGLPLFRCSLLPFSALRVSLLRLFGAKVGAGVVIHSEVVIKYPWHITIGDHCWIGERSWIDSLTSVRLGNNVCISQGAYLCTGNHDWSDPNFGLMVRPIELKDGSWVGAKSMLLPGATLSEGAIAAAGSVVSGAIPSFEIFAGNPAVFLRNRRVVDVHAQVERFEEVTR